jgi:penicillin amidase
MNFDRLMGAAIAAGLIARDLLRPRPPTRSLTRRLADFPTDAPVSAPVTIHWNAHQIPFIEAASLADLAVALGLVHAHLRRTQMEVMRRLARGRAAEMAGPLAIELDRTLRLMDFGRAVPGIIAQLTPDSRIWAEGFVRGVNHAVRHGPNPPEFDLLGLRPEPWTLEDLFTNGRLAATDVNWLLWSRLLRARSGLSPARWAALWPTLLHAGAPNPDQIFARNGSNAAAVAGHRTASGAALFAADPHLSVALPNIWLAAGMSCPGVNAAGLMPAGFPIVAIGRNRDLAWGGTSLHHAASDLFDVSAEPLTTRVETIKVRLGGRRRLTLRESALGPVVSDGLLARHPTPLALRWIGHRPSDEIGAMLGVLRAATPDAFATALRGFAIPGQNFLHATRDGHVGHLLGCASPRRSGPPADLIRPPEAARDWDRIATTADYPDRRDPPEGFVASANDAPPPSEVPAGYLFSPPDRVARLRALLGGATTLDLAAMAATQTDVRGRTDAAQSLAARRPAHAAAALLRDWDGGYDAGSAGALVLEAAIGHLVAALPEQDEVAAIAAVWQGRAMLAPRLWALPDAAIDAALDAAMALLRRRRGWGGAHRMVLRHYLGAIPVAGRRYAYGDYASPGGNDTLHKTGHGPVRGRHAVTYGASARFLADLADPDANRVVLLGGQDGFLGSTTFLDQLPLWRTGEYITLPLRPEAARLWPHCSELRPA